MLSTTDDLDRQLQDLQPNPENIQRAQLEDIRAGNAHRFEAARQTKAVMQQMIEDRVETPLHVRVNEGDGNAMARLLAHDIKRSGGIAERRGTYLPGHRTCQLSPVPRPPSASTEHPMPTPRPLPGIGKSPSMRRVQDAGAPPETPNPSPTHTGLPSGYRKNPWARSPTASNARKERYSSPSGAVSSSCSENPWQAEPATAVPTPNPQAPNDPRPANHDHSQHRRPRRHLDPHLRWPPASRRPGGQTIPRRLRRTPSTLIPTRNSRPPGQPPSSESPRLTAASWKPPRASTIIVRTSRKVQVGRNVTIPVIAAAHTLASGPISLSPMKGVAINPDYVTQHYGTRDELPVPCSAATLHWRGSVRRPTLLNLRTLPQGLTAPPTTGLQS